MTDARRTDRVTLKCEVEFRRHGDCRYLIELFDLSTAGCCISPPIRVEQNEQIFVRLPGIEPIHGRIAWVEQWRAGVAFDRPLYPAVFDNLVRRLKR